MDLFPLKILLLKCVFGINNFSNFQKITENVSYYWIAQKSSPQVTTLTTPLLRLLHMLEHMRIGYRLCLVKFNKFNFVMLLVDYSSLPGQVSSIQHDILPWRALGQACYILTKVHYPWPRVRDQDLFPNINSRPGNKSIH